MFLSKCVFLHRVILYKLQNRSKSHTMLKTSYYIVSTDTPSIQLNFSLCDLRDAQVIFDPLIKKMFQNIQVLIAIIKPSWVCLSKNIVLQVIERLCGILRDFMGFSRNFVRVRAAVFENVVAMALLCDLLTEHTEGDCHQFATKC